MNGPQVGISIFRTAFRTPFKHASATRMAAENVIVRIGKLSAADSGYGEACPRQYVTGETTASVLKFTEAHGTDFVTYVRDVRGLRDWVNRNESLVDTNPSAFGALEQAMLDHIGRREGRSLEELLAPDGNPRPLVYSAVIGDAALSRIAVQALAYRIYAMHDLKVKLSSDPAHDQQKLRVLKSVMGRKVRVRADANNLWTDADEAISRIKKLGQPLWAIEEPLQPHDIDGFRKVSDATNLHIILDESVASRGDLELFSDDPHRWIVNVRVSKMGGMIRATDLANRASELGIGVIIGAHVGETSLLTRAAFAVAQGMVQPPIAMEGAFGTRLLSTDVTADPIMFGRCGALSVLDHRSFQLPGNGLDLRCAV